MLGAILAAVVAVPASAQECSTLTIADGGDGQVITSRTDVAGVRASLVGPYLNLVIGEWDGPEGREGFAGESSVAIPDGNSMATVCPDGSVSFAPVVEEPVPDVVAVAQVVDVPTVPVSYPATAHRLVAMIG